MHKITNSNWILYSIRDSFSKLINSSIGLDCLQLNFVSIFDLDAYFVPNSVSSFNNVIHIFWAFK